MATQASTVDYIVAQLDGVGPVFPRNMFGEYAIYCDDKLVALVCDDQLFVKTTTEGRGFVGTPTEAAPYPGAKLHLLVPRDRWDDRDWLVVLFEVSAKHLPSSTPKKRAKA